MGEKTQNVVNVNVTRTLNNSGDCKKIIYKNIKFKKASLFLAIQTNKNKPTKELITEYLQGS